MADITSLSDAELLSALKGQPERGPGVLSGTPLGDPAAPSAGLAALSDADLLAALKQAAQQTAEGFAPRSVREAEPTREEMKGAYTEMARGQRDRQGWLEQEARTLGRGLSRALPFADDLAAGMNTLGGMAGTQPERSYQENLDRQRGYNAADETDRPVSAYGSQFAGSLALPMPGAGALKGAAAGIGYGAASGFGSGDDIRDRINRATMGAVIGAPLGAAGGKVAEMLAPSAAPTVGKVTQAAADLGVNVPSFLAADNTLVQRAAQGIRNVPLAGDPIVKATDKAAEGLGTKAADIARGLGGETVESAGSRAGKSIDNWIGAGSKAKEKAAYDAVDALVSPTTTTKLAETEAKIAEISARRQAARLGDSRAVNEVLDAVQAPGLTYEGIKGLRTHVGEMLTGGKLPEGMSQTELKAIYGALSKDLRQAVESGGGRPAVAAFERANTGTRLINERRESLARIVGNRTDASPAQIFDRLTAAAGGTSRADTRLLLEAKRVMDKGDWDGFVSAVVGKLGRDAEGGFSPDRFVTDFNKKISATGQRVLFGKEGQTLRKALDDMSTISSRMQKSAKRFGNPSGTAQNVNFAALGAAAYASPITTLGTVLGARVMAQVLSRPSTARQAAMYARAVEMAAKRPGRASSDALQRIANQFGERVAREFGVTINPADLVSGMSPAVAGTNDQ